MENWKQIKEYDNYEISNTGKVRSLNYKHQIGIVQELKPALTGKGYLSFLLSLNGCLLYTSPSPRD
jgi:hypothetical protein